MTTPASELSRIVNQPQNWDFSGADHLFAGVDLGLTYTDTDADDCGNICDGRVVISASKSL